MLYKKYKIKPNILILTRIKLSKNKYSCDVCCHSGKCTLMNICTNIFTPITADRDYYDYTCYIKEKQ